MSAASVQVDITLLVEPVCACHAEVTQTPTELPVQAPVVRFQHRAVGDSSGNVSKKDPYLPRRLFLVPK